MRRSVVLVASTLVALSLGLLWVDRTSSSGVVPPAEPPPRVASVAAQPLADRPAAPDREPVELRAVPPRMAINRYLTEDHLFEVFEGLRHGSTGEDLFVAKRIEQECHAATRAESRVGQVLSGRPIQRFDPAADGALAVTLVVPTPEQVDAAREIFRRCDGFERRAAGEHRVDAVALEARLLKADDPIGLAETIATHRVPPTPDRLRTVLASRDPVAITLLDEDLTARWQRGSIETLPDSLFGAPSPAMQLVGCDLGMDCGPTSFAALLGCLEQASVCGLDVQGQSLRRRTPSEQRRIEDTRSRYVDAITRGDYAVWGL